MGASHESPGGTKHVAVEANQQGHVMVALPHVGHFVLRDAPTQVIPLVRNWLAH
jgi:pimeloyl-ACP methyl ester carboxylesterase